MFYFSCTIYKQYIPGASFIYIQPFFLHIKIKGPINTMQLGFLKYV